MNLTSLLVDEHKLIPIEALWRDLSVDLKAEAVRMLEQGELQSQGRNLRMDKNSPNSNLDRVFDIPMEYWLDKDECLWDLTVKEDTKFKLTGHYSDDVVVEIKLYNTERFREFAKFEKPSISIDEFDTNFLKSNNAKMGAKVWASAAAALASDHVAPTGKKLAKYLLSQDDLWPKGKINERNLEKLLSPFVQEFKRLT